MSVDSRYRTRYLLPSRSAAVPSRQLCCASQWRPGGRQLVVSCSASDVMLGDCECEDMTASIRDQKISEFLQSVFRSHAAEDGSLRYEDLAAVLASLGRRVSGERIRRIRAKFDRETVEYRAKLDLCLEMFSAVCGREGTGLVAYTDPEFVLAVASLNVVDVAAIEDTVLASAFRTFDLVRVSGSS